MWRRWDSDFRAVFSEKRSFYCSGFLCSREHWDAHFLLEWCNETGFAGDSLTQVKKKVFWQRRCTGGLVKRLDEWSTTVEASMKITKYLVSNNKNIRQQAWEKCGNYHKVATSEAYWMGEQLQLKPHDSGRRWSRQGGKEIYNVWHAQTRTVVRTLLLVSRTFMNGEKGGFEFMSWTRRDLSKTATMDSFWGTVTLNCLECHQCGMKLWRAKTWIGSYGRKQLEG